MNRLYVIKIGGNVIDHPEKLEHFLKELSALPGNKILIHGGGKIATRVSEDLGVSSQLVEGRRITDAESLKVVTMVYAGLINKNIVASLQASGCNAIGLTGADGNIICALKRPIKYLSSGEAIDYGFVGDPDVTMVNTESLKHFLQSGFLPVFAAITHDGKGQLLNTNADTIASVLAMALSAEYQVSLIYTFEKNGVLRNLEDEDSVIRNITRKSYLELKEKRLIFDGMIPKLDNAFLALQFGVSEIFIGNADKLNELEMGNFGSRLILSDEQ